MNEYSLAKVQSSDLSLLLESIESGISPNKPNIAINPPTVAKSSPCLMLNPKRAIIIPITIAVPDHTRLFLIIEVKVSFRSMDFNLVSAFSISASTSASSALIFG